LEGKVAVITGGANGIGESTARRLAADGCRVVVADLDGERADEVAASLNTAVAVQGDVSTEAGVDAFVAAAVDTFGRLDFIHNNAAVAGDMGPIVDVRVEDFDRDIAVDLRGVFLGMQRAMRQMIAQGDGGAIVNTAALAGITGMRGQPAYVAAKHGVVGLTRAGGAEGAPFGIRVNAICPGLIGSANSRQMIEERMGNGAYASIEAQQPMGRAGDPSETADAVAWLLSDEASYVNGAIITVDGATSSCFM
jgi:NAD(P)-dependent dehydrogenase (short-subunit alcohol dehydrogenase family)